MRVKDENKKRAIIQHTIDVIFEKGIAGVKMSSLARNVGVSPSTLYVYYKSKDALITSIFAEIMEKQTLVTRKKLKQEISFKLKLKEIWLQWLKYSIDNYKEMVFLRQVKQSPYFEKLSHKTKSDKIELGNDIFEEGKNQSAVKDVDSQILSAIVSAILHQGTALIISNELSFNKKDTDMLFDFVWDAVKS